MRILFIDETKNLISSRFLGVCGVSMDASKYKGFLMEYMDLFDGMGWNKKEEFKGRLLFSKKADPTVSVERRLAFAEKLLATNLSERNGRWRVAFSCNERGQTDENRISLAREVLKKVLPRPGKGPGKDLLSVFVDQDKSLDVKKWNNALFPVANKARYWIIDGIAQLPYDYRHAGLLLADIIAYLCARYCQARSSDDAAKNMMTEFEPNIAKLIRARKILGQLKNVNISQE